ncbi:MAG TPA: hypothetical protein VFJ77_09635 [Gaiellaceae bacterium]|nr:hypothetical protein [Gaiellaceae bacterium]
MGAGGCDAYFSDRVGLDGDEVRVYRCDWGWCVKRGEAAGRSRFLDEAFELALGRRLDGEATRALIEMLDRELTARRAADGKTAMRVVELPDDSPVA